jgi:hypothetical protein
LKKIYTVGLGSFTSQRATLRGLKSPCRRWKCRRRSWRRSRATVTNLHLIDIKTVKIPLPPLATQQTIVAEIEAEQALVAANRELITRFEQKIQATLARIWGEENQTAMGA